MSQFVEPRSRQLGTLTISLGTPISRSALRRRANRGAPFCQRGRYRVSPAAPARCQYRYQNATSCLLRAADSESGLCVRHLRQKFASILPSFPVDSADLSKDLLPKGGAFSSAEDLREYLLRLLILMTEGRVSPRRASVLAYISNQLLHIHVVAEKESDNESQKILFDLPRPKRD